MPEHPPFPSETSAAQISGAQREGRPDDDGDGQPPRQCEAAGVDALGEG